MLYLCGSPSEGAGVFEDSLEIMHSADLQWTMPLIIFSLCLNMTLFYIYNKDAPPQFDPRNTLAVLLSEEERRVPHAWCLTVV